MKKLLLAIVFISTFFTFTACKKTNPYENKISQLRTDVYVCETENYTITAYPEIRENPFLSDGKVGKLEKVMIFKLNFLNDETKTDLYKIEFDIDGKTYSSQFEYKPSSTFLYCQVLVENLPQKSFNVTLKDDNHSFSNQLNSVKKSNTLDYVKILKSFKDNEKTSALMNEDNEIKIRLINNGDYDYYYVGFSSEEKTVSYLLDGFTGEIIAQKDDA